MREIKFRGKRVDNGDWVTGDLLQIEEDCRIWDYDITDNGVSDTLRLYEIWHNVDPATIGQYTGLRDKNGVEIYEGDKIKAVIPKQGLWSEVTLAHGLVFYKGSSFRAPTGSHPGDWVRLDSLAPNVEIEVLGTRWDTPGLIERSGE